MSEVAIKIESNNPVLITHKISKIVDSIRTKIKNIENPSRVPTSILDPLLEYCISENPQISSIAFEGLVQLVEAKYFKRLTIVAEIVSRFGRIKNYLSATSAICSIFKQDVKLWENSSLYNCQFSIQAPQHPLITMIQLKVDTWPPILKQMKLMINQATPRHRQHYIALLRPVFIYIICNPSSSMPEACKQQTWHLLMHSGKNDSVDLQLEIIEWLKSNDSTSCTETSNRILELIEYAVSQENEELCKALLPLIACLALDSIKYNVDPGDHFTVIAEMLEYMDETVGSIVMFLLAEIIAVTPTVYLKKITQIGVDIIEKNICSETSAYAFVASTVPWMAYATILVFDALSAMNKVIPLIKHKNHWPSTNEDMQSNKFYDILHRSHSSYYFYANLNTCVNSRKIDKLDSWLDKLLLTSKYIIQQFNIVISGLLLQSKSCSVISKSIKILLKICTPAPELSTNTLSLLLYKLANTEGIEETNEILFAIPDFALFKENMPAIIGVLESLVNRSNPSLMYVGVQLYLRVWQIEPRCHAHLVKVLIKMNQETDADSSFMSNVTCAQAIKFICETRPEKGVELVRLLSQILNRCTNNEGSAASALALRAISALCNSGIADFYSTWQVLSPKLNQEKRAVVIKSICEFFGNIPSCPRHNDEEFEEMCVVAVTKLMQLVCSDNVEIVEAAFKALSAYAANQIKVSYLPNIFTSHLKPLTVEGDSQANWQEQFSWVPGSCWIKMLSHLRQPALSMAGDLLSKFMSEELYGYRSGIYAWPMGEPVSYKYLPERSIIKTVGEYLRRYTSQQGDPKVAVECLRIFSNKYLKALPPIQFKYLMNAFDISDETKSYGISLACHQSAISPSAKEYLSQYLVDVSTTCSTMSMQEFKEKCWCVCTHIQDVCRGIISSILEPFLDAISNYIITRALVDTENAILMLNELLQKFADTLKDDLVHHDNKTHISKILQKLLNQFDYSHKISENIFMTILELPTEEVERITSPSVWDKTTDDLFKKAIEIRVDMVLVKDNEIPFSWMNPILQCVAKLSSRVSVQQHLLGTIRRISPKLRDNKSCAAWIWDLMCQIQALLMDQDGNGVEAAEFLCDVIFVIIIMLSSTDSLLIEDSILDRSHGARAQYFPYALQCIIQQSFWKDIAQQIIEWLHIMRTSIFLSDYRSIFHNALTSLKKEPYLYQNWTKYCSVKMSYEDS